MEQINDTITIAADSVESYAGKRMLGDLVASDILTSFEDQICQSLDSTTNPYTQIAFGQRKIAIKESLKIHLEDFESLDESSQNKLISKTNKNLAARFLRNREDLTAYCNNITQRVQSIAPDSALILPTSAENVEIRNHAMQIAQMTTLRKRYYLPKIALFSATLLAAGLIIVSGLLPNLNGTSIVENIRHSKPAIIISSQEEGFSIANESLFSYQQAEPEPIIVEPPIINNITLPDINLDVDIEFPAEESSNSAPIVIVQNDPLPQIEEVEQQPEVIIQPPVILAPTLPPTGPDLTSLHTKDPTEEKEADPKGIDLDLYSVVSSNGISYMQNAQVISLEMAFTNSYQGSSLIIPSGEYYYIGSNGQAKILRLQRNLPLPAGEATIIAALHKAIESGDADSLKDLSEAELVSLIQNPTLRKVIVQTNPSAFNVVIVNTSEM